MVCGVQGVREVEGLLQTLMAALFKLTSTIVPKIAIPSSQFIACEHALLLQCKWSHTSCCMPESFSSMYGSTSLYTSVRCNVWVYVHHVLRHLYLWMYVCCVLIIYAVLAMTWPCYVPEICKMQSVNAKCKFQNAKHQNACRSTHSSERQTRVYSALQHACQRSPCPWEQIQQVWCFLQLCRGTVYSKVAVIVTLT